MAGLVPIGAKLRRYRTAFFSLPPIEIGCSRFRSTYRVAETRVYAVSAGGGSGWGVVMRGNAVPHLPTPTPDPSPQGGGEKRTAISHLNLAPMGACPGHPRLSY